MSAPPGDRGQLDFLRHVQRIFDEGEFVATVKFALLTPAARDARLVEVLRGRFRLDWKGIHGASRWPCVQGVASSSPTVFLS